MMLRLSFVQSLHSHDKKKHFTSILNNIRRDHPRFVDEQKIESWAPGPNWSPGLEALPNGIKL